MMRKIVVGVLLLGMLFCMASCLSDDNEGNKDVTFTEDLTLDALYALLVEKGDALRFSDIPEKYAYIIPMPMVPQLAYPIDENTTFYIMQVSENEYSYILTVRASDADEDRDYSGVQEILSYLESR